MQKFWHKIWTQFAITLTARERDTYLFSPRTSERPYRLTPTWENDGHITSVIYGSINILEYLLPWQPKYIIVSRPNQVKTSQRWPQKKNRAQKVTRQTSVCLTYPGWCTWPCSCWMWKTAIWCECFPLPLALALLACCSVMWAMLGADSRQTARAGATAPA